MLYYLTKLKINLC